MTVPAGTRRPRRRRTRVRVVRWLVRLVLAGAIFAVGVAVGQALHDNPKPSPPITSVETVHP